MNQPIRKKSMLSMMKTYFFQFLCVILNFLLQSDNKMKETTKIYAQEWNRRSSINIEKIALKIFSSRISLTRTALKCSEQIIVYTHGMEKLLLEKTIVIV